MYSILDPKNDFVFKNIFGTQKNSDILISFLNSAIKPDTPIRDVKIINTDINKEYNNDKASILDIKAITNSNERINVEIQMQNEYDMIQRTLYYWSKLYSEKLNQGDDYSELKRTVCINILNFKYNELNTDNFHTVYRLKEIHTNAELTDIQEIHFIEIPKLNAIDREDNLTVWTEFLKNPNSIDIINNKNLVKEVEKAKDELIRISADESARIVYDAMEKNRMDSINSMSKAKRDIARGFLEDGIDVKVIAKNTGLTLEQIEKLRKEIN